MKIECTEKQKNAIISILARDIECFMLCDCDNLTCKQCFNRRIEWNIIDETKEHKQCTAAEKRKEELKDDSSLQKAVSVLTDEYNKAVNLEFVRHKIAYALYQTWKIFDRKSRNDL